MKTTLLVAAVSLLVGLNTLVESSGYGQQYPENSYGGGDPGYSSGSYGGDSSYAGGAGDHGAERPRVNLGISLKVPAMKINLGRMNMPRISIRAKIKQSNRPKVINVPEMHIDTQSKLPGPAGSQFANHNHPGQGSGSYGSNYDAGSSNYGGESSNYGGGYEAPSSYGAGSSSYYDGPAPASGYASSASSASYGSASPPAVYGGESSSYGATGLSYPPTYNDSPAPSSSSYGGQSNYNSMTQNTRSQYGSSPDSYSAAKYPKPTYSAPKQSYSQPKSGQSYSAVAAPSYQAPASNSYSPEPSLQYAQTPANQYGAQSQNSYQSAAPVNSYSARPSSYPSSYGSPGNSYNSGGYSSYEQTSSNMGSGYESPLGYQPLEPGHTVISATNDNYDGQTQLQVASNPPRESRGYHRTSSYGVQQESSYNSPSSYQSSSNSNSYNNAPVAYQQQPSYSASQPTFDDSANYAAQSYQGNYGTRTSY